jgi:hypothetical protein
MLVEWKRLLRSAGIRQLHTEDWSDEETAFRPQGVKPFPDFAELFSLPEKLGILRRAWGRWGWQGVKTAVAREAEVHRLLTRERILGLALLVGRAPEAEDVPPEEVPPEPGEGEPSSPDGEEEGSSTSPGEEEGVAGPGPQPPRDVSGLPLFTQGRPET